MQRVARLILAMVLEEYSRCSLLTLKIDSTLTLRIFATEVAHSIPTEASPKSFASVAGFKVNLCLKME